MPSKRSPKLSIDLARFSAAEVEKAEADDVRVARIKQLPLKFSVEIRSQFRDVLHAVPIN
jgi:hypothetical protein